jgi:hypothetical protein
MKARGVEARKPICGEMRFTLLPADHVAISKVKPKRRFGVLGKLAADYLDENGTFKPEIKSQLVDKPIYFYTSKSKYEALSEFRDPYGRTEYAANLGLNKRFKGMVEDSDVWYVADDIEDIEGGVCFTFYVVNQVGDVKEDLAERAYVEVSWRELCCLFYQPDESGQLSCFSIITKPNPLPERLKTYSKILSRFTQLKGGSADDIEDEVVKYYPTREELFSRLDILKEALSA